MVKLVTADDVARELGVGTKVDIIYQDRGACYRSECKYIAGLVGNEIPFEERDYFKAMQYTNRASRLGLSVEETEIMGRMLAGLGQGTRFAGDPAIDIRHGENSSTHSLQAVNLSEKILYSALRDMDTKQKADASKEIRPMAQQAALTLLMHDMGEICGEAAFAFRDGVRFDGGLTKQILEKEVLERTLNWAIASVEAKEDRSNFLDKITSLREKLPVDELAAHKKTLTKEELEDVLNDKVPAALTLSESGEQFYHQMMALWYVAESIGTENPYAHHEGVTLPENPEFLGTFVKSIDHTQGTAHFIRFGRSETNEEENEQAFHALPNDIVIKNLSYLEGKLKKLWKLSEDKTPFMQAVARNQRNEAYGKGMNYIERAYNASARLKDALEENNQADVTSLAKQWLDRQTLILTGYEKAITENRPPAEASLGAELLKAAIAQECDHAKPTTTVGECEFIAKIQDYCEERRTRSAA